MRIFYYFLVGGGFFWFYWLLVGCERFFIQFYHADKRTPLGLKHALTRLSLRLCREAESWPLYFQKGLPRLSLVPSSQPFVQVVRTWRSQGSILISQGLLATADDDALEQILRCALLHLTTPGIVIRSYFLRLAFFFLNRMPVEYLEAFYQGGQKLLFKSQFSLLKFLWFCIWFPWAQGCLRQAQKKKVWDPQNPLTKIYSQMSIPLISPSQQVWGKNG